jgi:hypothetical protein
MVQPVEPNVQPAPCSVSAGTRFTARLDQFLATDSSLPGESFSARVVAPVMSSCHFDFIRAGATLRGRVTRAEPGKPPVLAIQLIDVDTSVGARPIPAAIRSVTGFAWVETNVPNSSYRAFVLHPPWAMDPSGPASQGGELQQTFPEGALIELELTEPVVVVR